MKRWLFFVMYFFLFFAVGASAQEEVTPDGKIASEEAAGDIDSVAGTDGVGGDKKQSETSYIEMDIRTSSLMELASWCRELGLSDGGSREDLAARLRSHYEIASARAAAAEERTITIESAKTTEYFTLEAVDEEYARLKGDVIVSLKDGDAVHRIKAWEILFNRTRNVLTATGKVEYVKEEGDTAETFKGDSITVNLDNWSSIFLDGASTKSGASEVSAYRFAGTVISRNDEEATVLTGADITNPANEEALWSLHASKLWLLPGNDWAILNAVLKVGNIPVLWLPAFYYPADEIVFHPVLGVRTRDGAFFQTTTYLMGSPKAELTSENSLTKIFGGGEGGEKKREGVFLRSTGEKKADPNATMLKLFVDSYVNMGFFLGTELLLPRKGVFSEINLEAGIGLTRNVDPVSYRPDSWGNWNDSDFFGLTPPIRYRLKTKGSANFTYGSFSWDLAHYSDQYFERDFMKRTEILEWFAMLRDGFAADDIETFTPSNSYNLKLDGSIKPNVKALAPYFNFSSVPTISSNLLFNTRANPKPSYSSSSLYPNPGDYFFFPQTWEMYSIGTKVTGTPLTLGASASKKANTTGAAPGDSLLSDMPVSPWADSNGENKEGEPSGETGSDSSIGGYAFAIPTLSDQFKLPGSGGYQFTVGYSLNPSSSSVMNFNELDWKSREDIDWGDVSSIKTRFDATGSVSVNVKPVEGGVYSGSLAFEGNGAFVFFPYLNPEANEYRANDKLNSAGRLMEARNGAAKDTKFKTTWALTNTFTPFYMNSVFSGTNFSHSLVGLFVKNEIDNSTGKRSMTFGDWDTPFWDWKKENLTTHKVAADVNANVMDNRQNFTVSMELPPLDSSFTANATLRAWISETSVGFNVKRLWEWEDQTVYNPLSVTETLLFGWGRFSLNMGYIIDPDTDRVGRDKFNSATASLTIKGFAANFTATYAKQYSYNENFFSSGGDLWEAKNEKSFEPTELNFSYKKTFEKKDIWKNRFSFSVGINSGLNLDLQQYTNSSFTFNLTLKMNVTNFLDVVFSTRSENTAMYRYLGKYNWPFFKVEKYDELYKDQGLEDNFFMDLFNSFNFFNTEDRIKSSFKLKELSVTLIHHLGDWNAKLEVTTTPKQNGTKWEFHNEISFLIQWVPIGEIKTDIIYKDDQLTVK